jgi:hypothetical protein
MKNKENIERQIRGWFPKEPVLSTGKLKVKKHREPPMLRERLVGGLGAAGGGLTLSGIVMSFVPAYPHQAAVMLSIVGVPLLAAVFLVWLSFRKGGT